MPNFNGKNSPVFSEGPKGLADMLASALRGSVSQGLGFPGDIEGLGRMGINALGGRVNPHPTLPNTERIGEMLPAMDPLSNTSSQIGRAHV